MRAILAAAFAAFVYYADPFSDSSSPQEPTTKRCRIVEERPASPGIGVVIGPVGLGVHGG